MIEVHRLHNMKLIVNADLIEFIESTPDTMLCMTTGKKVMVTESVDEVIGKVIEYKKRINRISRRSR